MRVLIDTNILISAALNKDGVPYQAYKKSVQHPCKGIVCDQNIDEIRKVFNRKFPDKIYALERFLSLALPVLEIVPTPTIEISDETKIRDVKDRPILRAAVIAAADILITGDKDFLESGIKHPRIMTASEFMKTTV